MASGLRVAVLSHELPPIGGGGGRVALELARRMVGLGHLVHIITAAYGGLPPVEELDGITIYRVPCRRGRLEAASPVEMASYVRAAIKGLRRLQTCQRYDLAHCHFIIPAGAVARYGGGHLPYLVTCHGSDVPGHNPGAEGLTYRLMRPAWRQIVGGARALVSPSRNVATLLRAAAPGLGPALHQVPNGYPVGRFSATSYGPHILMVSRLIPLKGFQWFLQGIAGIDLGYQVDIVGDGPMRQELEQLASRTPTRVKFHGWLDNGSEQMRQLFEKASLFVFPSATENFPTVLLEAMDAGLAIVTVDSKGCPEVVGDAGLLVAPNDGAALRQAVQSLLRTPERIPELGRKGRQRLAQLFDWRVVERSYDQLYEATADGW